MGRLIKQHRFSIYKILICLYTERIHRKVFDNLYIQEYQITRLDRFLLKWYSFLSWLIPDFRAYLKHWKPILIRGYNIKKLSIINQIVFWRIRKVNVERYSSYIK